MGADHEVKELSLLKVYYIGRYICPDLKKLLRSLNDGGEVPLLSLHMLTEAMTYVRHYSSLCYR